MTSGYNLEPLDHFTATSNLFITSGSPRCAEISGFILTIMNVA